MVIGVPDSGWPLKEGLGGKGARIQDGCVLKSPVSLPFS